MDFYLCCQSFGSEGKTNKQKHPVETIISVTPWHESAHVSWQTAFYERNRELLCLGMSIRWIPLLHIYWVTNCYFEQLFQEIETWQKRITAKGSCSPKNPCSIFWDGFWEGIDLDSTRIHTLERGYSSGSKNYQVVTVSLVWILR